MELLLMFPLLLLCIFVVLASELRWIDLIGTGTAGQQNDAIAQWTNETGHEVSLRDCQISGQYKAAAANTDARVQLSKQNAYINATGDRNWKMHLPISQNGQWTTGSYAFGDKLSKKYGVGQVTLEPGETIYLHDEQDANIQDERVRAIIGYSLNK